MYNLFTIDRLEILSELFTDMAAGWFGTILIYPGIWINRPFTENILVLLLNFLCGIFSLVIAFRLRKESKK